MHCIQQDAFAVVVGQSAFRQIYRVQSILSEKRCIYAGEWNRKRKSAMK